MQTCFICQSSFIKGVGICCSRQCHNKRINARTRVNDRHVLAKKDKQAKYELNPKLCNVCNVPLIWSKKNYKFCSSSCSAKRTNQTRDPASRIKQKQSLVKTLSEKSNIWPHSKVTFKNCASCNNAFRVTRKKPKYCSFVCKVHSGIKNYRRACKFKISNKTNPELFDIELLQQHGWYRAANHPLGYNPKGATWDHLFRIEDGFKLGLSPDIIAHPANAEMISWEENFSRKKSMITYAELLERIANYEK